MYEHAVCNIVDRWYKGLCELAKDDFMAKMALRSADQTVRNLLEGLDQPDNAEKRAILEAEITKAAEEIKGASNGTGLALNGQTDSIGADRHG